MASLALTNGGTASNGVINTKGTGFRGLVAVTIDSTSYVTLQGSVDGTTYFVIETFTASTLKEVTLCPYMRVNGAADTSNDNSIGSSTCTIYYNSSAYSK